MRCLVYILYITYIYIIETIFVGLVCIGMHEDTHVNMSPRTKGLVLKMEYERSGWSLVYSRSWPVALLARAMRRALKLSPMKRERGSGCCSHWSSQCP
jgi:hypothetical protein